MEDTPCTYRISVKAIIRNDAGDVLLIREEDGCWELPGGGLEHGENPRKALTREIFEETGFTADWISDKPETFWTIKIEVGSSTLKWFAYVAYETKVSGNFNPSSDTSDKAEEFKYFSQKEIKTLKLHEHIKPFFSIDLIE